MNFFFLNVPPVVVVGVAEPEQVVGVGAKHAQAALSQFPVERGQFRRLFHARRTARKPDVEEYDLSSKVA